MSAPADQTQRSWPAGLRRRAHRWLPDPTPVDGVAVLWLLVLVVAVSSWTARFAVAACAVLVLARPALLRSWRFWVLVLVALAVTQLPTSWQTIDNHQYLMMYVTGAVALARASPTPLATLGSAARWLLVGVFGMAALYKLLTPDFLDGRLFVVLAHDHSTVQNLTRLLDAGLAPWEADPNPFRVVGAPTASSPEQVLPLLPRVTTVAPLLAVGTVLVEALVATAFALPGSARVRRLRLVALIGFAVVTYALAPVTAFAATVLLLGYAQADHARRGEGRAYLVAFVAVPAMASIVWTATNGVPW